jgi:hypothetical protein
LQSEKGVKQGGAANDKRAVHILRLQSSTADTTAIYKKNVSGDIGYILKLYLNYNIEVS